MTHVCDGPQVSDTQKQGCPKSTISRDAISRVMAHDDGSGAGTGMCSHAENGHISDTCYPGVCLWQVQLSGKILKLHLTLRENLSVGFSAEDLIMNLPDQVILIRQHE